MLEVRRAAVPTFAECPYGLSTFWIQTAVDFADPGQSILNRDHSFLGSDCSLALSTLCRHRDPPSGAGADSCLWESAISRRDVLFRRDAMRSILSSPWPSTTAFTLPVNSNSSPAAPIAARHCSFRTVFSTALSAKIGLHAQQSRDAWSGECSRRLALVKLEVLLLGG